MIDEAIEDPVGVWTACAAVGEPRARYYRRHRKSHGAQSPYQRLVAAGSLTPGKKAALMRARNALHPTRHQAEVARLATQLQRLALAKTGPPPRAVRQSN